jgi:glycosyltransferase involved in cell wall biosynthesis
MSKIIYLPIEELPARYTQMMNAAIYPKVDISLYPKIEIDTEIKRGQFLDIVNTCKFKAAQLQMIADLFNEGKVENGDAFLIGDIFFPGIESIKYMAELQDINVRVYGINYAGRADKTDFVQKLSGWADASEAGYHLICDGIFVGSCDHKFNVCNYFGLNEAIVHATGYVWDLNYMKSFAEKIGQVEKEDFVIWPHRWSEEKGIKELLQFAKSTKKKIVITSSGPKKDLGKLPKNIEYRYGLTKLEYFELMAKARWYLSTAYQETFGYSIQEAIYFNCNILVPNRACCSEMVTAKNVYTSIEDIDKKFDNEDLTVPFNWTARWHSNIDLMLKICKEEIDSVPENYFKVKYLSL